MKSKLTKQKEQAKVSQPAAPQSLDIEAVLREKYSGQTPPPALPRAAAPATVAAPPPAPLERRKRDVVRVSVDFPRPLYEAVVLESDEHAQTMREFMLTLVRQYFERKKAG
ncbi:MAG: hypothetical protein ACK4Q5_03605 [Saprospiraceae bacterium]